MYIKCWRSQQFLEAISRTATSPPKRSISYASTIPPSHIALKSTLAAITERMLIGCFFCVCAFSFSFLLCFAVAFAVAVRLWLQVWRHPWRRSYHKRRKAQWETDADYCAMVSSFSTNVYCSATFVLYAYVCELWKFCESLNRHINTTQHFRCGIYKTSFAKSPSVSIFESRIFSVKITPHAISNNTATMRRRHYYHTKYVHPET